MTSRDTAGLDKDFFPMGNRRGDKTLVPGSLQHLATEAAVGVNGLPWADILMPTMFEERHRHFASRQGSRHCVPHDHLPNAAGEVLKGCTKMALTPL
jgi:hypothetical protein